jgi:hypothetical protein
MGPVDGANLQSVLLGTAGLSAAALAALLLTLLRKPPSSDPVACNRVLQIFLLGLAAQCLHFAEEFLTRLESRFPVLLGLPPWSENFFVVFNLAWLCVWILSALGLQRGYRAALFLIWFFAIASVVNGIAHPALALVARGYFPGLFTSPIVGLLGILLSLRLLALTRTPKKSPL